MAAILDGTLARVRVMIAGEMILYRKHYSRLLEHYRRTFTERYRGLFLKGYGRPCSEYFTKQYPYKIKRFIARCWNVAIIISDNVAAMFSECY